MSGHGLSVGGASLSYGATEIYSQDASILGWTCGNVAASALDVARFYWELLGPEHTVTSASSLKVMETISPLSVGWAAGDIEYGFGLMVQNPSPRKRRLPPLSDLSSYIGHGGDTYGFMSDNGFYPQLNASISVVVNQDANFLYPTFVATCAVVQAVVKHRGMSADLGCPRPRAAKYECVSMFGQPTCYPTMHWGGRTKAECEARCSRETVQPAAELLDALGKTRR